MYILRPASERVSVHHIHGTADLAVGRLVDQLFLVFQLRIPGACGDHEQETEGCRNSGCRILREIRRISTRREKFRMKARAMSETPYSDIPSPDIEEETGTLLIPQYNVVLLDDDDHSYDYVIEMLRALFQYSQEVAYRMAREVDSRGRVIVATTYKERAEMKRDQIQSYGADWRIPRSAGSMSALVEPAG